MSVLSRLPIRGARRLCFGFFLLSASTLSWADFKIPGFELVHTVPVATDLATNDLRNPVEVWSEMFDRAQHRIDIGQFYASGQPGSQLDTVIEHLQAAGQRGVTIRFLLEEKGLRMSDPATLDRLRSIPNLTLHVLPYGQLTGGSFTPNIWSWMAARPLWVARILIGVPLRISMKQVCGSVIP